MITRECPIISTLTSLNSEKAGTVIHLKSYHTIIYRYYKYISTKN